MNSVIYLALPLLAFSAALMYLLPHITPVRYFFVITVPPDFPASETGRSILRFYHARLTAVVLLSAAIVAAVSPVAPRATPFLAILLPAFGGLAAYLTARNRARPYSISATAIREAELSTAPDRLPRWIALSLPPFAAPLAAAAYLRARWDEIPARFPVHWDFQGQPDRWAEKSARGVYGPLLVEAALMLLILLIALVMFYGARRGRQRNAVLKLEVGLLYYLAYTFTIVSLMPVIAVPVAAHLVPGALFAIFVLAWCFKLARDPKMPVDSTPDEFWRLGSIYYNPDDPAIFVQKRMGFGYTFNFGNTASWVMIGAFVVVALALMLVVPR